jgi:hypothetical protein
MKLKIKQHHEELIKAFLLFLVIIFLFFSYDSFVDRLGHITSRPKIKLIQAVILFINKIGGKYLITLLFCIPIINFLIKAKNKYMELKIDNNAKDKSSGIIICGTCKRIFDEKYNFKHSEITHKEFNSIIENVLDNREDLLKLVGIIVFIERGNSIVIKNVNGKSNTGIYATDRASEFLNEIKAEQNIKNVMELSDWINSFCDSKLLALLSVELIDIGTINGYISKLNRG